MTRAGGNFAAFIGYRRYLGKAFGVPLAADFL
jgi:hypothetical protein